MVKIQKPVQKINPFWGENWLKEDVHSLGDMQLESCVAQVCCKSVHQTDYGTKCGKMNIMTNMNCMVRLFLNCEITNTQILSENKGNKGVVCKDSHKVH